MTPETFLNNFSAIANAPGGVQRLREVILYFALQGKLSTREQDDDSVEILVKRIKEFHIKRQNQKGRRNRQTVSGQITSLFEFPLNWVTIPNQQLFTLQKGKNPKDLSETKKKYSYLDIEALDRGNVRRYTDDEKAPKCTDKDILVVCDGSRSGLVLNGQNGAVGSTLAVVETLPEIQPFIKLIFLQGFQRLNSNMKGAAIPHLDTNALLSDVTGLPPLAEQKRIVNKVDQLMSLCDTLEQQQQKRSKLISNARSSALSALSEAQGSDEIAAAWKRVKESLAILFEKPGDVEDLKKCILQNAVMGTFFTDIQKKRVLLKDVISFGPKNGHSPKGVDYETNVKVFTLSATTKGVVDLSKFKYAKVNIEKNSHLWLNDGDILNIAATRRIGIMTNHYFA